MSDPYGDIDDPTAFATKGQIATPDNNQDLSPVAKTVSVTSVGGGAILQILPLHNADGEWITYNPVVVGFSPPYRIRRIGELTTCEVATCVY